MGNLFSSSSNSTTFNTRRINNPIAAVPLRYGRPQRQMDPNPRPTTNKNTNTPPKRLYNPYVNEKIKFPFTPFSNRQRREASELIREERAAAKAAAEAAAAVEEERIQREKDYAKILETLAENETPRTLFGGKQTKKRNRKHKHSSRRRQ